MVGILQKLASSGVASVNAFEPIVLLATAHNLYAGVAVLAVVVTSIAGNIFMAIAARADIPRRHRGIFGSLLDVMRSFSRNVTFLAGLTCMAFSFYSWLFALSRWDLSLVAPATASLTFIGNTLAAKVFLGEIVDSRRWISAVLVGCGILLLEARMR